MLLAVDAGNTNVVFAVYEGTVQRAAWRIRTEGGRTADEYAAWLYPLFLSENLKFKDITAAIVSSVVPDENRNLRQLCTKTFSCEPLIIGQDFVDLDIPIRLHKPEEVGADRLVNAVAVLEHYTVPAIIIDFGTATTFDVVDAKGGYCGGVIAPGVNLSMKALHAAAAKLPKVSVKKPEAVIGKDTVSAMQSGLYWGYLSMIEGLIDRLSSEMKDTPQVIATGGLAPLFAGGTDKIHNVDEDLILKGLVHIHHTRHK